MRDFYSHGRLLPEHQVQGGLDGNVKDSNPSILVPQTDGRQACAGRRCRRNIELTKAQGGSTTGRNAAHLRSKPVGCQGRHGTGLRHAKVNELRPGGPRAAESTATGDQPVHGKRGDAAADV
jgi:hypothetical protein